MAKRLPSHVEGLLKYLAHPTETANEDLAVGFFRHLFKNDFKRQGDAGRADGYVAGAFVLELKGATNDWLQGLMQGVAYNRDLDFSMVVVGAQHFLAVWNLGDLPEDVREYILTATGAASRVGSDAAKKLRKRRNELLKLAEWHLGGEFFEGLFSRDPTTVLGRLESMEKLLRTGRRVRTRITTKNFHSALKQMAGYFEDPLKAVRAFYSMVFSWNDGSLLDLSAKNPEHASLGGERITHIRPGEREALKTFVDGHVIALSPGENIDDFFARYDVALDAVDKGFRTRNGIFFTDLDLSKFVLWLVRRHLGGLDVGKNYLVIDPACGSGNLVTNWRSPLEIRHKVVSEIEPELLFAIERRMQGDAWHNGKFTVVPKVGSEEGLNFLDKSAEEYLRVLKKYLNEKGHEPDRPLAFLCNPPFRNDDDQTTGRIRYAVHKSILELTGADASVERYLCFLAQMKLLCRAAADSGLPGDSLLLIFTKTGWLTDRPVFKPIRTGMLREFEDVVGVMVNSREFFDVKGSFPICFTVWRHRGESAGLSAERPIPLIDLTWIEKETLATLPWGDLPALDAACNSMLADKRSMRVSFGVERGDIATWCEAKRIDFQREKTKAEVASPAFRCGLPVGDSGHGRKKTLGHFDGTYVGFMDDLTPCRIRRDPGPAPWFRLDKPVMDARKARCLSGPPDQKGFTPGTREQAVKLFTWYAIQRTFAAHRYPMWADALNYWPPMVPAELEATFRGAVLALALAENDCVETTFPANNPLRGSAQLVVTNPMCPVSPTSYWTRELNPLVRPARSDSSARVIDAVLGLYRRWASCFKSAPTLTAYYERQYFVGSEGTLTKHAGVLQIYHYATETKDDALLTSYGELQSALKTHKERLYELLVDPKAMNYFGASRVTAAPAAFAPKTAFDQTLNRRIALASCLVSAYHAERFFGRTKMAKLFYLADAAVELDLDTQYEREAAGPLDKRALYHSKYGIEALAERHGYFVAAATSAGKLGDIIRYRPGPNLDTLTKIAPTLFGKKYAEVIRIRDLFAGLDTEQCEIVATLFASWNDLLLRRTDVADEDIVEDVRLKWHVRKQRFTRARLLAALQWMRRNTLVPKGVGNKTRATRSASE